MVSFDLLANAIISGVLVGGFYAGVAAGATISFGLLDVANIAHPAFVVFGAYGAFLLSERSRLDPLVAALFIVPVFYVAQGFIRSIIGLSSDAATIRCEASRSFLASCSSVRSSSSCCSALTTATRPQPMPRHLSSLAQSHCRSGNSIPSSGRW